MNYEAYYGLWRELREILDREQVEIVYKETENPIGQFEEGYYLPSTPKRIFISKLYEEKDEHTLNSEPLVVAHELGHYFDYKANPRGTVSLSERERRANSFMIALARKHGLQVEANREAARRMNE